jgi:hypothetical protein
MFLVSNEHPNSRLFHVIGNQDQSDRTDISNEEDSSHQDEQEFIGGLGWLIERSFIFQELAYGIAYLTEHAHRFAGNPIHMHLVSFSLTEGFLLISRRYIRTRF